MATVQVRDVTGEVLEERELPEGLFGVAVNVPVMHQVVVAGAAAQRSGTASTKTRAEVSGGGVKPWRQKGTGRARAGSIRAPHWTGGGLAFPPMMRSFESKVNRKARRAAMRSALSAHALGGTLGVLDPGGFDAPSTKDAAELVGAWGKEAPLLLVAQPEEEALIKSFRNLARVEITVPSELEVHQLVRAQSLLITEPALEQVQGKAS